MIAHLVGEDLAGVLGNGNEDTHRAVIQHQQVMQLVLSKAAQVMLLSSPVTAVRLRLFQKRRWQKPHPGKWVSLHVISELLRLHSPAGEPGEAAAIPVQAGGAFRGLGEVTRKDLQLLMRGVRDEDAHRVLNPHHHSCLALMLPAVHLDMVSRLQQHREKWQQLQVCRLSLQGMQGCSSFIWVRSVAARAMMHQAQQDPQVAPYLCCNLKHSNIWRRCMQGGPPAWKCFCSCRASRSSSSRPSRSGRMRTKPSSLTSTTRPINVCSSPSITITCRGEPL